jgi:hypothetical protein
MFHRPSLMVRRKALNFGNLEEQGRKKEEENFKFLNISKNCNCNSNFQSVTIAMEIFKKIPKSASVTVG